MKRDAYGDDGPSYKRPRHNEDEVCFLIPSKVAGSIIGKGGSNISRMRNQYKASITVPDCTGPERVLTIGASDIDTVLEILKEILPNLADNYPQGQKGFHNEELDVRLLIHQSRAGCVIGKAGSKIKEIRERTDTRLKIFSSTAPQSTERVVQILGKPDNVAAAVHEVLELVRQVPIKGAVMGYDPHNYDEFYAEEYGGFGGGGRGPARGPPPRGAPPRGAPPRGAPPRGRPPPSRPLPPPPRYNDFGGSGPAPRGNFSGPRFPPRGNFRDDRDHDDETSTQVTIPKDLAGAIIGKSGSRIRAIRAESGAAIDIAEPAPGAGERVITITGAPRAITLAQYLLQQSVHESNPNMGRGGKY